jgi:putative endonuclease
MHYVYILQSLTDQSFYIGYTTNPDGRLEEHNSGKSPYTSKKTPWIRVYLEPFTTKKRSTPTRNLAQKAA